MPRSSPPQTAFSHRRVRIMAIWARVAAPLGARAPVSLPSIRPLALAQLIAGRAKELMAAWTEKPVRSAEADRS